MLLLSKPKRGMDAAQLSFDCGTVSHLKPFFLIRKGSQIVKRKVL